MKKIVFILALMVIVSSLGLIGIALKNKDALLNSPVLGISKFSLAENIWFPQESTQTSQFSDSPQITSQAAFFVEANTGKILYEKNAHQKLPIASLVKIMTAIVVLENKSLTDTVIITKRQAEMEPDKMLLRMGEKLTVEELLDGVFLVSANDGAEALADNIPGGREEFIKQMNSKSLQLGMKDSKFINPTGLEEDGVSQYSTAFEVALMSKYAISKWPQLLKISSQPYIYLPETPNHQEYDLYSGINLLTTYPGVIGFKTGYTPEAGLTLVTIARKGGYEVMGVLLNAENRRDDAKLLLDYSFQKLGVN